MNTQNANQDTQLRRAFGDVTNRVSQQQQQHNKHKDTEKRTASASADVRSRSNVTIQSRAEVVLAERPVADAVIRSTNNAIEASLQSYQHTGKTDDIDARDADDVLNVTSYVNDMYEYHRLRERVTTPSPSYMDRHTSVNSRMREILVDWLIDVHYKFKMVPETLYLCVNVIDRFLEKQKIARDQLQLVGVTVLLLASKYEEIYPPTLADLVHICDGAYNEKEILKMEVSVLRTLKYNMTVPSAHVFLIRYLKAGHASRRIVQYAVYVLDSTLQHYSLLEYLPSQLAAAAVLIARAKEQRHPWSPTLLKYTSYVEDDVIPVARAILSKMESRGNHVDAVERRYAHTKFGSVAGTEFRI